MLRSRETWAERFHAEALHFDKKGSTTYESEQLYSKEKNLGNVVPMLQGDEDEDDYSDKSEEEETDVYSEDDGDEEENLLEEDLFVDE